MSEDTPIQNLDRLIKMLKMTTADNDGQALVAIRAANRELSKLGADWESLLRGKVTIMADPFTSVPEPTTRPSFKATARVPDPPKPRVPDPPPPPPDFSYMGCTQTPPPDPPKPRPAPQTQKRDNRFSGPCKHCGGWVDSGNGWLADQFPNGKWRVEHKTCPPKTARKAPKPRAARKTLDDAMDDIAF